MDKDALKTKEEADDHNDIQEAELLQATVEAVEKEMEETRTEAEGKEPAEQPDEEPASDEQPMPSKLMITFEMPGSAQLMGVQALGMVTPGQMALAGLALLSDALNIWNGGFYEMLIRKVVKEFLKQSKEAAQEAHVRDLLRRGGRIPS